MLRFPRLMHNPTIPLGLFKIPNKSESRMITSHQFFQANSNFIPILRQSKTVRDMSLLWFIFVLIKI